MSGAMNLLAVFLLNVIVAAILYAIKDIALFESGNLSDLFGSAVFLFVGTGAIPLLIYAIARFRGR